MKKDQGTLRPTTRLNFLVAALRGNAVIIDTLSQRIEEAFPNEVGEISDLDAVVCIVNDSYVSWHSNICAVYF